MSRELWNLLDEDLVRVLRELNYKSFLPIQEKAIPVILKGHNTLIVAPTGSGKTEAAVFPVLSLMLKRRREGALGDGIKTIYISPLRALNRDIIWRIEKLIEKLGFKVMVRHGDTTYVQRREFLRRPPDFSIMTLESLSLLLSATPRSLWKNVQWIIVDEVQEFLESERGSELSIVLERLRRKSVKKIQTIGLSATLSRKSLDEARHLLVGGRRIEVVSALEGKEYEIKVDVVKVNREEDLFDKMAERISNIINNVKGSVLVFVNTRSTAEALGRKLRELLGENLVRVHHGSLHRELREEAERLFKEGKIKALVATSSMELGVDIGNVDLVIQFMSPRQVITMTQRAGRAGHRLNEVSRAIIVVPDNLFEVLEAGVIAFRTSKGDLEDLEAHKKPYDALAHQIAGMVIESSPLSVEEIYDLVTSTYPYESLTLDELEELLNYMDSIKIIKFDKEKALIKEGRRTRSYFYRVSMIPPEQDYIVVDIVSDNKIGEINERFIELMAFKGNEKSRLKFVLGGKLWEILDVDPDQAKVLVKPVGEVEGYVIPSWQGELIPVSYKVAREVCALLSLAMDSPESARSLLRLRGIPEEYLEEIVRSAQKTAEVWGEPYLSPLTPVIEDYGKYSIVYICLGSRGNLALAILLTGIMESMGVPSFFETIPYAIVLKPERPWSGEVVKLALKKAKSMNAHERVGLLIDLVKKSTAYLTRFSQVAKKMGIFDPDARVTGELLKRALKAYEGSIVEREAIREMFHEKLDIKALNEFLDNMNEPVVVRLQKATPLAEAVLGNPYIRGSQASIDLKAIAIDKLIKVKKARILSRDVLLLCLNCGYVWKAKVSEIPPEGIRCPKCRSLRIAPLPNTEWGEEAIRIYKKFKRGERLKKDEQKVLKDVMERAELYSTYFAQGMGRLVIEALMARGVGPQRATRVIEAYFRGGEIKFYEEILKAEEEYLANRKFWKT
jgi:ATP-dependent Lhr-like helicase